MTEIKYLLAFAFIILFLCWFLKTVDNLIGPLLDEFFELIEWGKEKK